MDWLSSLLEPNVKVREDDSISDFPHDKDLRITSTTHLCAVTTLAVLSNDIYSNIEPTLRNQHLSVPK